jgi:hypothetical protein
MTPNLTLSKRGLYWSAMDAKRILRLTVLCKIAHNQLEPHNSLFLLILHHRNPMLRSISTAGLQARSPYSNWTMVIPNKVKITTLVSGSTHMIKISLLCLAIALYTN